MFYNLQIPIDKSITGEFFAEYLDKNLSLSVLAVVEIFQLRIAHKICSQCREDRLRSTYTKIVQMSKLY